MMNFFQRVTAGVLMLAGMGLAAGCQSSNDSASGSSTSAANVSKPSPAETSPSEKQFASELQLGPPENSPPTEQPPSESPSPEQPQPPAKPPEQVAAVNAVEAESAPAQETKEPKEKIREPLFKNWPQPEFVLFLTGRQSGYIEPCGCTGLANQKGGLSRRHTLLKQLQERSWTTVPLDVGNQVRRFGRQSEIKLQTVIEGLTKMKYRAVTLGPDDLRLSALEVYSATTNAGGSKGPFVSANTTLVDDGGLARFLVVEAAGQKVGITAVLGAEHLKSVNNPDIVLKSPAEELAAIWPKLRDAKCDLYVLLAHASLDETRQLAEKVPHFDVVVTAGGAGEPPYQPEKIPNSPSIMVEVGTKGMYVAVLGVFKGSPRFRLQKVPLDDRFPDSAEMLDLLKNYQEQLQGLGLEELGLKPIPHPSGRSFAGSAACADCHTKAAAIWKETPHARATQTLVKPPQRAEIARHFDPECLSCHVTGWNPQEHFPYKSGYLGLQESPLMHGVGCENCHGPAAAHVAVENGDEIVNKAKRDELRRELRVPLAQAERKCLECHDVDNSPDFHAKGAFEKYWKKVAHPGKD